MKKIYKVLSLVILFWAIFAVSSVTQATWNASLLDLTWHDAYYTDLENDNANDDIVARLYVEIYDPRVYAGMLTFDIYLTLELPSGMQYSYHFHFTNWDTDGFLFTVYFHNHATESGWYTIHAIGSIDDIPYAIHTWIKFDPPGSGKPKDPIVGFALG